jgi:hypothetical protein
MTDNITLRRADAKMLRNVLRDLAGEYWSDTGLISLEERAALVALDAALAEPLAKPEPATREQALAQFGRGTKNEWWEFRDGWQAAERFHGIGGSKT